MENKNILIYILSFMGYILIINFIANFISLQDFSFSNLSETMTGGDSQKIGLGSSVSLSINRPRPYGNTVESGGNSKLYLFGLIPLPLKSNGINFIYFHIIFALIIVILLYRNLGKTGNNGKKINN